MHLHNWKQFKIILTSTFHLHFMCVSWFHVIYTFICTALLRQICLFCSLAISRKLNWIMVGDWLLWHLSNESESGKMYFAGWFYNVVTIEFINTFYCWSVSAETKEEIYFKILKWALTAFLLRRARKRVQIKSHNLLLGSALKTRLINVSWFVHSEITLKLMCDLWIDDDDDAWWREERSTHLLIFACKIFREEMRRK